MVPLASKMDGGGGCAQKSSGTLRLTEGVMAVVAAVIGTFGFSVVSVEVIEASALPGDSIAAEARPIPPRTSQEASTEADDAFRSVSWDMRDSLAEIAKG